MISYRNARVVVTCDGCHTLMGDAERLPKGTGFDVKGHNGSTRLTLPNGYPGHACSSECAERALETAAKPAEKKLVA